MNSSTDLHNLAYLVAPELCAAQLYIVHADELPAFTMPDSCGGFALTEGATGAIRAALGEEWQGTGPAIVLGQHKPPEMLKVTLHELAHILPPVPTREPVAIDPPFAEFQYKLLSKSLAECEEPPPGPPDSCHDWQFIRRALHLFVRATAAGYDVPIYGLFAQWWQSQEPHWLVSGILREAQVMRLCSFAEIEQTPPPAEFMSLWNQQLEWYQKFQKPKEAQ